MFGKGHQEKKHNCAANFNAAVCVHAMCIKILQET